MRERPFLSQIPDGGPQIRLPNAGQVETFKGAKSGGCEIKRPSANLRHRAERSDLPQHPHALPDLGKIEFLMAVENCAPLLDSGAFVRLHRRENKGFLVKS